MDPVGIARRRRLEINDQQMDLASQELRGLPDEIFELRIERHSIGISD
jgi:hypothetical protein